MTFTAPLNVNKPANPFPRDTFVPPPLDDSLTIPEIYDFNFHNSPNHPLWTFAETDGTVKTVTWSEAVLGVHTAQRFIESRIGAPDAERKSKVVAILATTDSPTFWMLMIGIMRLGWCPFPISTRNSEIGVAHLLAKVGAGFIFTSTDSAIQTSAAAASAIVVEGGHAAPQVLTIPTYDELRMPGELLPPIAFPAALDSPALILHSSGSTSFPKPIVITHRRLLGWARAPTHGTTNLTGHILSIHTLPMFHSMGTLQTVWTAAVGMVSAVFSPNAPPVIATPDLVLDAAILTRSSLIFCVPAFVEHWSRDPTRLEALKSFYAVVYSGAPLDKEVGDALVKDNVSLVSVYGLTETGPLTTIFPSEPEKDGWQYFKIAPNCNPVFLPYGEDEKVFQLILVDSPSHLICVHNTEVAGSPAYDTSDLLIQHPTRSDLWMVHGRSDDQIMHKTGEKTNPVPIEAIIGRHPLVASVLVFGRSRLNAGILVEPIPTQAFDPSDVEKLAKFRNTIWESVEEANSVAPSHSRIFKEMIVVASPSKPFQYTPKGTPRRHVVVNSYEDEINATYVAVETSQVDIPIPSEWNFVESTVFARAAVENTMVAAVLADTDDLFFKGCDSLQATWIRNTIIHGLQTAKIDTSQISTNFIYDHPSITKLATYLAAVAGGYTVGAIEGGKAAEMDAMVDKYSDALPVHHAAAPPGDVIFLTGSTGGLGSYLVENLVRDPTVSRIYALNRPSSKQTIRARQADAFRERGVAAEVLDSPKLVLLEGDTSKEFFDLGQKVFETIQSEVTNIMHNAWKVDFNISLSSMESLVSGTRRLIDLALASPHATPPTFTFTSSIGVFKNWDQPTSAPEAYVPATMAVSNGYGESKWVAEALLLKAAELNPSFKPTVVRVGQLAGGSNGSWNTSEWLPSLIKSAQVVGCLPLTEGIVSWLPCHLGAAALVEARNSGAPFMNLCHPRPVTWESVFEAFATGLDVPLVPYADWLAALEEAEPDATQNPALLLLEFFRASNIAEPNAESEALGFPRLDTDVATSVAPSLLQMKDIGPVDVNKWLSYWRSIGFLA